MQLMTDFEFAVNGIFLTLTNEGRLYPQWLKLAREDASISEWRMMIGREVKLSPNCSRAVAIAMRDYYSQHLSEF